MSPGLYWFVLHYVLFVALYIYICMVLLGAYVSTVLAMQKNATEYAIRTWTHILHMARQIEDILQLGSGS